MAIGSRAVPERARRGWGRGPAPAAALGLMLATGGAVVARAEAAAPLRVVVVLDGERSIATVAPAGAADPAALAAEHLDAYTAPRLAGYTDPNPCAPPVDFELRVAPPPSQRNGAVVASAPTPSGGGQGSPAATRRIAFDGRRFELPLAPRGHGASRREVVLHVLTHTGQAELIGRASTPMPSGAVLPLIVQDDFVRFYGAASAAALTHAEPGAALLEYAGDLGFCDPCVADPPPIPELHELGASWAAEPPPKANPMQSAAAPQDHQGGARNVFVTRYRLMASASDGKSVVEFRETAKRQDFQVRYVVRRPYTAGPITCAEAGSYRDRLVRQRESAIDALVGLTGWSRDEIEKRAAP